MVDYRAAAAEIAQKYGIDPDLFARLIQQESDWNPNAGSEKGALGLTQLMPGTALDMGVLRIDPLQNLEGGAKYLRQQLDTFGGDKALALAAYNAGPGNVKKYGGIPPFKETQDYVSRILGTQQPNTTQQGGPAVDQYAQPPQQKGILSYITDPEKRAKLGLVLSSLASTPNAGVQQMLTNKIAGFEDTRTQNKTAQWLVSKGRSDLAEAVAGGMISPKEAVAAAMQAPEEKGRVVDAATLRLRYPNAVIEEGLYSEKPDGTISKVGGGGTNINMPGAPVIGPVPPNYEVVKDANGNNVLRLIPGGPAATEANIVANQNASLAAAAGDSLSLIDSVMGDPNLGAITGMIQGRLPPVTQAATDLVTKIDQMQGQAFLQAFQSLKGGGAITEREGQAALNAVARLQRVQSEEAFKASLQELRTIIERGKRRLEGQNIPENGGIEVGEPY
jgi:hypothetical protein